MARVVEAFVDLRTGRLYAVGQQVANDDPAIAGREALFDFDAEPVVVPDEATRPARGRQRRSR